MSKHLTICAAAVVGAALAFGISGAAAAQSAAGPHAAAPENQKRDDVNAGVLGLAGGQLEGAPIRLAAEIARVVDDGARLHVLPVVTRGPAENIASLLYLRGVDMAIINTDILEQFKASSPNLRSRMSYVLSLFPSEVHVLVRPGIERLEDLAGRKVNFNTKGTAAAYSGPLIFSRLGISTENMFIPHQQAMEQMTSGDIDAVFFITSKPVDAFLKKPFGPGFKFLPVPYDERLADYYMPAALSHADYPALIPSGQEVSTVAVPTALVAFNWAPNTERYRRLARFVDRLFDRIDDLQAPGFDPKWRSVNLSAEVPSLTRARPAQDWLDRAVRAEAAPRAAPINADLAREQIARQTSVAPAEQERLLREFLRWSRDRR